MQLCQSAIIGEDQRGYGDFLNKFDEVRSAINQESQTEASDNTNDQRIRREIRSLTYSEWEQVAAALNIMKNTSDAAGTTLYGSKFVNYDSFVCRHLLSVTSKNGDLGHLGFQFFTFHRTLALQFEESLLSILSSMRSTVKAAPYWDYSIDTNDAENSVIFSDDYFGSLSGDENNGYTLSDGKFAFWKVHNINDMDNQTELDWASTNCPKHNDEEGIIYAHRNPYGYLRYPMNFNDNPYVTRMGGSFCGFPANVGDIVAYDACIALSESVLGLDTCISIPVHAPAHFVGGGTKPLSKINDPSSDYSPNLFCSEWVLGSGSSSSLDWPETEAPKQGYYYGCFTCPWDNDPDYECVYGIDDPEDCALCDLTNNDGSCTIDGITWTIRGSQEDQWMMGDFKDTASSPNDPLFMFHHINMDRLFMTWQLKYNDGFDDDIKPPYFGLPESGYQYGMNLDDPICGDNGCAFYNIFNGTRFESLGDGPYTLRDIMDATQVNDGIYTYDTIQDDLVIAQFINEELGIGVAEFIGTIIGVMVFSIIITCLACCIYQRRKESNQSTEANLSTEMA